MTRDGVQPLRTNRISLSAQAQEYLLSWIENGAYQPGISRATLREALQNLEKDGIVVRMGTFVAPGYEHRPQSGLERLESILELAGRQRKKVKFSALQIQEMSANTLPT
jgi:DNA-binding GntR family transcriptional regulator